MGGSSDCPILPPLGAANAIADKLAMAKINTKEIKSAFFMFLLKICLNGSSTFVIKLKILFLDGSMMSFWSLD